MHPAVRRLSSNQRAPSPKKGVWSGAGDVNTVGGVMRARVRLDKETRRLLERIAPEFGGREATVGEALRRLAADHDRKQAVRAFFDEWEAAEGPLSEEEVSAMGERHGL